MHAQSCPLSGETARFQFSFHAKEQKCFHCKQCLDFTISQSAPPHPSHSSPGMVQTIAPRAITFLGKR